MSNITHTVKIGNELYVFVRGQLVMKRWLDTGITATFHVAPKGTRWNDEGSKDKV